MPHPWSKEFVSVCMVGTSRKPIWAYETWIQAVPILQPLADTVDEKPAIRTTQSDGKDGPKLGRLTWNDKGHRKWTHGSPDNAKVSKKWVFMEGEVWLPSWSKCSKPDQAPDLFFAMANPHIIRKGKQGEFNQYFQIAMPLDAARTHESMLRDAAHSMAALLKASHLVGRTGNWYDGMSTMQSDINNNLSSSGSFDDPVYQLPTERCEWTEFGKLAL